MQAKTKQEARRIAYFGAKKMDDQGYRYERLDIWNWWVSSPASGGYNVALFDSGETHCGCKFFEENTEFGTCKHIMRLQWLVKEEADQAARDAEEDGYHLRYTDGEGPEGCVAHPHVPGLGV